MGKITMILSCSSVSVELSALLDWNRHSLINGWSLWISPQSLNYAETTDLAYVIHTSGTSRDNGMGIQVKVPLSTMHCHLKEIITTLKLDKITGILVSPPTFDPSIIEICLPFLTEGTLVLPDNIFDSIQRHQVNLLMTTPALFQMLTVEQQAIILTGKSSIKTLCLGGESFPMQLFDFDEWMIPVYNMYGTTECSVWASFQKVDYHAHRARVPLGPMLPNTQYLLLDEKDQPAHEGVGYLWIGGIDRVCYLEDETEPKILRNTNDLVEKVHNDLYYIGRKDSMIKIQGQRLHLLSINDALRAFPEINRAETLAIEQYLVAFVIYNEPVQEKDLLARLSKRLPFHAIPNAICALESFPVTFHGKIDKKQLIEHWKTTQRLSNLHEETIISALSRLSRSDLDTNDFFIAKGGDSIKALHMVSLISDYQEKQHNPLTMAQKQNLFTHLINFSINHFLKYLQTLPSASSQQSKKRKHTHTSIESSDYTVLQRGRPVNAVAIHGKKPVIQWTLDMEKCIDATPIIIQSQNQSIAFIGSHSGLFIAVDLTQGSTVWETRLPDRIESSACIDTNNQLVIVGCYDSHLYFIDLNSGDIKATFQTGDQIKCSPQFFMNEVWCGSHYGIAYCLCYEQGAVKEVFRWESGSPIFASPSIDLIHARILVCNLKGSIQCFDSKKKSLWTVELSSPIFSSPAVDDVGNFHVAAVDHWIYQFKGMNGDCVWKTKVDAPIFSSPTCFKNQIIIGSHGNGVLILDSKTGNIIDSIPCSNPVYASPCVSENGYIVWASTDGQVHWENYHLELDGNIFSSPLIVNKMGDVLVGCRNNLLYYFTWIA